MSAPRILFLLSIIIAFLSSCTHNTNCVNTFPCIANGHILYYRGTAPYDSSSLAYSSTTDANIYMATSTTNGQSSGTSYVRPCNDKLYAGRTVADAQSSSNYVTINNAPLNTSWTYTTPLFTYTKTIIAKNMSVTVIAGTYNCDKILVRQIGYDADTEYVSPSVGQVKYVSRYHSGWELDRKNF